MADVGTRLNHCAASDNPTKPLITVMLCQHDRIGNTQFHGMYLIVRRRREIITLPHFVTLLSDHLAIFSSSLASTTALWWHVQQFQCQGLQPF